MTYRQLALELTLKEAELERENAYLNEQLTERETYIIKLERIIVALKGEPQ